jgi:hypothetical protein
VRDVYLSVRVGSLVIKSYIMNRPLLSRLTSCGAASYVRGIQCGLSVRVSLLLRGFITVYAIAKLYTKSKRNYIQNPDENPKMLLPNVNH